MTWPYDEQQKLKNLFNKGYTDKEIGEKLNRSVNSIECKRRRLGLLKYKVEKWSKEEKEKTIELFKEGLEYTR